MEQREGRLKGKSNSASSYVCGVSRGAMNKSHPCPEARPSIAAPLQLRPDISDTLKAQPGHPAQLRSARAPLSPGGLSPHPVPARHRRLTVLRPPATSSRGLRWTRPVPPPVIEYPCSAAVVGNLAH